MKSHFAPKRGKDGAWADKTNTLRTSYAGLTRLRGQSRFGAAKARVPIFGRKRGIKVDHRVKPGDDS